MNLKKAIEILDAMLVEAQALEKSQELEKIDPKTKLPGTMLDKSELHKELKAKMSKCMKTELEKRCWSGYKAVPGKEPFSKGSCVKKAEEAPKTPKAPKMDKPKQMVTQRPMTDAHAQKIQNYLKSQTTVKKDDKPHAPNSPEDKAHDIVEEGLSIKQASKDLGKESQIKKMFNHLRSKKAGWTRSPANREKGK